MRLENRFYAFNETTYTDAFGFSIIMNLCSLTLTCMAWTGLMDNVSPSTLLSSISRLGVLTSDGSTVRPKPIQKYCQNVYDISSIVNPLLEDLCKSPEEQLNEVLRDLDTAINEASGLIGNWHQTTSKIHLVSAYKSIYSLFTCSPYFPCIML